MMWKWGWSYPCNPSGHRPKVKFCSASSLWASHLSHWKAIDRGSRSTRFSQPVMARRLGWKMTQSFGCSRRWWKKIGSLEIWSCFHEGSPGQDTWHTWHISCFIAPSVRRSWVLPVAGWWLLHRTEGHQIHASAFGSPRVAETWQPAGLRAAAWFQHVSTGWTMIPWARTR